MPKPSTTLAETVSTATLLRYRLQGYSYRDIAAKFGLHHSAVQGRLKRLAKLTEDPQATKAYTEHEAEILDAARMKIVTSLVSKTEGKEAQKASINNLAYAFTQLNQAVRLLRGQSTVNVSALTRIIEQAQEHKPAYRPSPQHIDIDPEKSQETIPDVEVKVDNPEHNQKVRDES